MALELTEEHRALAASVHGWAERHCPREVVRAAADGADRGAGHYRASLGPSLARQGLLGLHLAADHGGQGFTISELAIVLEGLGRRLVPGCFLPTVLASALITAGGPGHPPPDGLAKLLTGLADCSRTGAVALGGGLTGSPDGHGGLVVHGSTGPVLGGSAADVLVLPVRAGEQQVWAVADAAWLHVTDVDSLDLTRPAARVTASGAAVPADRVLTGPGGPAAAGLAATLLGAEACGIADWAVHTAAEYARTRRQFGRPIGQFQAVKHRCARMLTMAEEAAAAVWDAARACSGDRVPAAQREFAATVAAVVAADAAVSCTHEAIQVLGGIGYTWEHDAHLYYRRALSLRAVLGPPGAWAQRAAELALGGTRRSLTLEVGQEGDEVRRQVRAELAVIAAAGRGEQARRLAEGGWVMPHLPRPWGRGAAPLEQAVIAEEMRAAGLRAPQLAIGAWVVPALVQYGTAQQRERFLPPTLRGEVAWCQLFSEPGAGSDLAGLSTRAEPVPGGWRITGQKIWTSLARQAGWAICIARTDPAAARHDGISYFLVDMSSPGVQVRPLRDITGAEVFNQVFLDGVYVPEDCVVGEVNGGWKVARTTLANERVALSGTWAYGSGVDEMLAAARAAAGTGPEGGGLRPADMERVGRLVCDGHAVGLLGLRVALKQLSGTQPGATSSVRKLLSMQHAQQISDLCWSMSGPDGALGGAEATAGPASGAYWARQVLFTRALTIGGGTTDIQLNIIGERLLGLPRDPDVPEHASSG